MKKLWLIIKREYLVRVRRKAFIVATLLTPLGMGLLMFVSGYVASKGGSSQKKVLVKDESGIFSAAKQNSKVYEFDFSDKHIDTLIKTYSKDNYDLVIHIPSFGDPSKTKHNVAYYTNEKLGISTIDGIEGQIQKSFKNHKIKVSGIDRSILDSFKMDIDLENGSKDDVSNLDGKDTSSKLSIIIGTALGGLMGFIMYMVIFIYGGMVMRSVMEEKINRIVEVMISSVKPTTLMMGKILGVGAVGLTQLAIWMILVPVIAISVQLIFGFQQDTSQLQEMASQAGNASQDISDFNINEVISEIKGLNWLLIIPSFIVFFFGGYFIYSSMFAAIGSAVGDDMGEAQQLMLPIIIPVIIAFIMMPGTIQNPHGMMAVVSSIFPLTSPIIMPSRLAFDPPMWQILLSILTLILTCWFFAWLAGRIYRVGILMYGKKISFKELAKWLTYKS